MITSQDAFPFGPTFSFLCAMASGKQTELEWMISLFIKSLWSIKIKCHAMCLFKQFSVLFNLNSSDNEQYKKYFINEITFLHLTFRIQDYLPKYYGWSKKEGNGRSTHERNTVICNIETHRFSLLAGVMFYLYQGTTTLQKFGADISRFLCLGRLNNK